jgi:biopolymer transport protein ExbD
VARAPKAFDVWFVAANTVYKGVPYNVVADWTQEGRLGAADQVRPAGTEDDWIAIGEYELLADYLPRSARAVAVPASASAAAVEAATAASSTTSETAELPEPEEIAFRKPRAEEDDDVDMIPLIDVSMVLLVFFIIMRSVGALAPVDVPEMRYAGELSNDPSAVTITIEKKDELSVVYSVRVGQTPAKPEADNLTTPEQAVAALKVLLNDAQQPPDVRIACRKELPRERVYELRRELEELKKKNYINSFSATVIEAPKDK